LPPETLTQTPGGGADPAEPERLDVLIIGAGLSGIGSAHYLQERCPGKTYAILEAREAIGGTWDLFRYPGIRSDSDMHTLGYRFRPWTAAKSIADGESILDYVRATAREAGIDTKVRFGHRVIKSSWSSEEARWTVTAERADGTEVTISAAFIMNCSGYYRYDEGFTPEFPGLEDFAGSVIHPQHWPEEPEYEGKRVVVIGSNNSAHDICAALWEHGADVTMVQRSSTHVVRSDTLMEIALGDLYSEQAVAAGVSTEKADMIFASLPYRILAGLQVPVYEQIRERDADFYARLEAAGFQHDWGEDGSGLFMKYLRRASGYYIDVGASELVASGQIKLQAGQVDHLTRDAVVLADGTELPADVVVYATGYESMNGAVADLISPEVADRVGKVWGLGSGTAKDPGPWEGEERNMWRPTQQPGLWFHGGNLHQSRHYSLYLALQLKARAEGIDTPVYGLQEVHHTH